MFYYTLGNLRPELRSTQRSIACITCPLLKKYGFEAVLKPFIDDVNILATVSHHSIIYSYFAFCPSFFLQHGVEIEVDGHVRSVKGTVLALLADTLAAHQLGGFKIGVGFSLRKCRTCMATAEDIRYTALCIAIVPQKSYMLYIYVYTYHPPIHFIALTAIPVLSPWLHHSYIH